MLAYKKDWLDSLAVKEQSKKWWKQNFLTEEQWADIKTKNIENFYSPNVFIRIGLFFFTTILVPCFLGIFGWIFFEAVHSTAGIGILCLLIAGGIFFVLELLIKQKNHFCSGVDDALTYMVVYTTILGLSLFFVEIVSDPLVYLVISFPILFFAAFRYIDRLLTLLTLGCFFAIIFFFFQKLGNIALQLMPFIGMIFSFVIYILGKKNKNLNAARWWKGNLEVLEISALLLLYTFGNYFVVKEANMALFPPDFGVNQYDNYEKYYELLQNYQIPFAWLFWFFTIAIPFIYIFLGLFKKDRIILRAGMLLVAISVVTFKYYFSVAPLSVTATFSGALLVAVSYVSIRYLRKNASVFTYVEDKFEAAVPDAEALLIVQTFGNTTAPNQEMKFGGGDFGGGGAGGDF